MLDILDNHIWSCPPYRDWVFGLVFCKVSSFISHLAIAASVSTMLAIAVER